jgi:hypothetical protein
VAISVTLLSLIQGALLKVNAISLNESVPAAFAGQGVIWANQMIDGWGLEPGTIPFESREVFALTPGRGGTATSYTIGPGGDFNTTRPEWLVNAGLLQLSNSPPTEIPRDVLTDRAYQAITQKDLQSTYFTSVYYNQTWPLGRINLYPVPNTSVNSLVLYLRQPLAAFTDLTTAYVFPPGYAQTIEDNLALLYAEGAGRQPGPILVRRAAHGLSLLKRANLSGVDMGLDAALTQSARRPWNILSDS